MSLLTRAARLYLLAQLGQADRLDRWRQAVAFGSGVHDQRAPWLQVGKGAMKAARERRREAALDLHCPLLAIGPGEDEVDLRAVARADEVLAPAQADCVARREEALRAADPQLVQSFLAHLGEVERAELDECDPPCQALARLGHQVDRGGAQHQEPAGSSVQL